MKKIPLTQGLFALVDDEDYERVMQHKWCAHKEGGIYYACRSRKHSRLSGKRETLYLHTFLLGVKGVDHRDGNGLNDQRYNLRTATLQQNGFSHRRKSKGVTSKYRGVSWRNANQKWEAGIKHGGKTTYLGQFILEEAAARAYDKSAIELFGEFASPNFRE